MPRLLITSDYHLSEQKPRCRLDEDWTKTQEGHLDFIAKTANKYKSPVCIVGDIFDRAIVTEKIKIIFLQFVDKVKYGVYILAGNHCLPHHSWSNVNNSSFGVIWNSGKVHGLDELGKAAHFGEEIKGIDNGLLFIHELVFKTSKDLPPNVNAKTSKDILDKYPEMKWIFCGDNHHSFNFEYKNRHLINSGCINRQASDFKTYQPIIYFVDTDKEIVEEINMPDNEEIVDDSYIVEQNEKEERISAFVEKLKKNEAIELDFLKNIEKALLINKKLSKETVSMINELCSEEAI
jgi:hypothetical protein